MKRWLPLLASALIAFSCTEEEPNCPGSASKMEDEQVPLRLLDLVHPAARKKGRKLGGVFREEKSIERHQSSSRII